MRRFEISKSKGAVVAMLAVVGVGGVVWSLRAPRPGASTRRAREIVGRLRTMPASPLAASGAGQSLATPALRAMPEAPVATTRHTARVTLPDRSTEPLRVEDNGSGVTIDVQVRDVSNVVAQSADGYYVYPHAHTSGGTILHRTVIEGAEDFVSFETRPAVPEVDYQISLGEEVSGLRLVGNTLEMVDQEGTPRLRAEPPYVVGADGTRTDATLAVEGCAVDTDASAPWGRDTVDPGARTCTVKVRWPDESVVYPAVLDPRWTTTGSMTTARQGHTATLLSTGNVLVVGGTSNGTTALASAELYNRTTGTWAATGSMTGARTLHTATQLNTNSNSTTSGKVLVAGGLNGWTSQNTAQLYSPSAGTWTAAANLNAARHGQTATLLASGNVLVAGGLNGTTVLNTAAVYNPSSGTGAWTATGNMPQAVKFHTATRLNVPSNSTLNNKVLVVGGNSGTASVSNVQLFDGTSTLEQPDGALGDARGGDGDGAGQRQRPDHRRQERDDGAEHDAALQRGVGIGELVVGGDDDHRPAAPRGPAAAVGAGGERAGAAGGREQRLEHLELGGAVERDDHLDGDQRAAVGGAGRDGDAALEQHGADRRRRERVDDGGRRPISTTRRSRWRVPRTASARRDSA